MVISLYSVQGNGGGKRIFYRLTGYCLFFSLSFPLIFPIQRWRNSLFFIVQPVLITFLRNSESNVIPRCPFFPLLYFSPLPSFFFQLFVSPPPPFPQRQIFWLISFSSLDRISISWWASRGWRERPMSKRRERRREKEEEVEEALCARSTSRDDAPPIVGNFHFKKRNEIFSNIDSRRSSFLFNETWTRRVPSPSLQQYPIDILALRAPVVLLPLPGASIISVTGIGESSSIKGPISDDKDLEMNGPRHSNGSLSSPSCPTARFSAIPPTKQSCLELLITPMMDIGRRIWDTNNYGQAFSSDTLLYFLIFTRFNYTFEFDPIKVNERGNCRCWKKLHGSDWIWNFRNDIGWAKGRRRKKEVDFLLNFHAKYSWSELIRFIRSGCREERREVSIRGQKSGYACISASPFHLHARVHDTRGGPGARTVEQQRLGYDRSIPHPPLLLFFLSFFLAHLRRFNREGDVFQHFPLFSFNIDSSVCDARTEMEKYI